MTTSTISFDSLLRGIINQIINPIILLLSAFTLVLFLYETYQLIHNTDSTEHEKAKKGVLWSFIGLVIIFSVYGILNIATATFGLQSVQSILY